MYVGLSVVSVYLLLLLYFSANNDYQKVSLQLSSEQSVGDVRITQLDWKRVPQARSRGCKSSVAITAECWRHYARQTDGLCV